jgi:hypothetical protein
VPTISMFYGIIIFMYFFDDKKHHLPHIHAAYAESTAVYAIEDGACLEGSLPRNKQKLVEAWIVIHREDLMANWRLAVNGQHTIPVKPLE